MKKKLKEKLNNKQKHIATNTDISDYGYIRRGFNSSRIQQWSSKQSQKDYRQFHKEETKKYRDENKIRIQKQIKTWYENNKKEVLEKNKIYAKEHPDQVKETHRRFCLNHKEELREKIRNTNNQKTEKRHERNMMQNVDEIWVLTH